ncbi:MAG: triose-phosphate isomerase [Deltaproteobacteria bacterium]|nr:triose-phosphate isomerase [Deltaproteobacteria bacterium]
MSTPRVRPFFCGNWKLFGSLAESVALATGVRDGVAGITGADVGVSPSFVALTTITGALKGSSLKVAAQNGYWEEKGAFTGEISMGQIADAGASCVILGHSERRTIFGETDLMVNKKTRAALAKGLTPIVCVGETLDERDGNRTLDVVGRQVDAAFSEIAAADVQKCVIAYEPVWAIGTGRNATPAQAVEVHAFIRSRIATLIGGKANQFCIQYGGSVKPDNVASLLSEPEINGALVGGASLTVASFVDLVKKGTEACSRS